MKLETRSHWKKLSTPRHKGCSLSNHLLIKNVFSFPHLLFHVFILLDSLVTSIDLVDYLVCYHSLLVVFHILQVLLRGYRGQHLRKESWHSIHVINQI